MFGQLERLINRGLVLAVIIEELTLHDYVAGHIPCGKHHAVHNLTDAKHNQQDTLGFLSELEVKPTLEHKRGKQSVTPADKQVAARGDDVLHDFYHEEYTCIKDR